MIGHTIGANRFESRNNYAGSWAFIFSIPLSGLVYSLYVDCAPGAALCGAVAFAWVVFCAVAD
jgi:hypothetical protein